MAAHASASLPAAGGVPPDLDPADEHVDLDTRIGLVEQRLVAREQRLRGQFQQLGRRADGLTAPRTLLPRLVGGALAGMGLLWALRRRGGGGAHAAGPAAHLPQGAGAAVPPLLLSLLPMAWPLLPVRWRSRVSPATAATVLGLALPLLQKLLAPRNAAADADAPPTVPQLDLRRYAGTWHELARLPTPFERACAGQPQARYTPQGDGLVVRNTCRTANGRLKLAQGLARVVPGSGGARLQVSFAPAWLHGLPFVWAELWVLHVDEAAPDYRVAIAGHPSRRQLWLLSRSAQLPDAELQQLVDRAAALGYDTSRLLLAPPPD